MNGWIVPIAMIIMSVALLFVLKVRGAMLNLAAAALLVGGAGYALQGRPGLSGARRSAAEASPALDVSGARHAFFGTFTPAERWLVLADAYGRTGDTMGAAQIIQSAINASPRDPELWTAFANALVENGGSLTPAARLAYGRASALAPASPGPKFFLGLALLRSGNSSDAVEQWKYLLAASPKSTVWRPMVEQGLLLARQASRRRRKQT